MRRLPLLLAFLLFPSGCYIPGPAPEPSDAGDVRPDAGSAEVDAGEAADAGSSTCELDAGDALAACQRMMDRVLSCCGAGSRDGGVQPDPHPDCATNSWVIAGHSYPVSTCPMILHEHCDDMVASGACPW